MTARFVWYDLNTKDEAKAKDFYPKLFGWKLQSWKPEGAPPDMPEYSMICIGEKAFGGINQLPADAPAPSHWMGHIQVDDVDAAVERAKRLKATFPMGVMEVPTVGRMAAMMDPQGCAVSLFQPAGEAPTLPGMGTAGMVGWNELVVADVDAAKTFYSEVVGWKWRQGPMEGMEYHLFGTGEEGGDAGGLLPKPPQVPVSAWLHYFTTENLDEMIAKVKELGGQVMGEPFEVPTVGKLATCIGPDGAVFALAQWEPRG